MSVIGQMAMTAAQQDIIKELRVENTRLREALKSASAQCGNVIYNCEQRPADNERHLSSWKGVKESIDAALNQRNAS